MALTNRIDLVAAVGARVSRIPGGLDAPNVTAVEDVIDGAVLEYSRLVPLEATETYSGDGSTYSFAVPSAWMDQLSTIVHVEHPNDEQTPQLLDAGDYRLYPTTTNPTHLRFTAAAPSSGTDNVSLVYTCLHTVDDSSITIPTVHHLAIEYLGAAHVCELYATQYEHTTDPTIVADSVDYGSKGTAWTVLAKYFRGKAYQLAGVMMDGSGNPKPKAAGAYIDIDPTTLHGGQVWRSSRQR